MSHVAPMRAPNRPKPTVSVERRADGTLVLSAGRDLLTELPLIVDHLQHAAERRPNVAFLPEGALSTYGNPADPQATVAGGSG